MAWAKRHPSQLSPQLWEEWLASSALQSPYLLPQWALFWEQRWPNARAEVWTDGDPGPGTVGLVGVRRPGMRWDRLHILPYGTPGGCFGPLLTEAELGEQTVTLWESMVTRRTIEVTLNLTPAIAPPADWAQTDVTSSHWVLELTDHEVASLEAGYSESHRRNIRKGEALEPTIRSVASEDEARALESAWRGQLRHESRIVLNPGAGLLFARIFAPTGAMVWRTAVKAGIPVSTCLWLTRGDTAVYLDGAMIPEPEFVGVNHLLFARVLGELAARGVRRFDFGAGPGGTTSAGLAQFKQGWGARAAEHREVIARRRWYHALRRIR